jgi:hypothetical protein
MGNLYIRIISLKRKFCNPYPHINTKATINSMYERVGAFLLDNEDLDICLKPDASSNRAMAIVETRPDFWLPWVIANAARVMARGSWNLYVFGTEEVFDIIDRKMKNIEYKRILVPTLNISGYSQLLMSPYFWNMFADKEEHVMIFQKDCFFVRPPPEALIGRWAYLGAKCGFDHEALFTINGGFSLRSKKDMLMAISHLSKDELTLPEDVAFTRVLRRYPAMFRMPTMKECSAAFIETEGDPATCVGMHGTDKFYAPTSLVDEIVARAAKLFCKVRV